MFILSQCGAKKKALITTVSIFGAVVLALRVWRGRAFRPSQSSSSSAGASTLASKYAAILREQKKTNSESKKEWPRVLVLFGSATGNAEQCAKSLVTDLTDRGVDVALIDPSRWTHLAQLGETDPLFPCGPNGEAAIALFLVSTTGEGEVPANVDILFAEMQRVVAEREADGGVGPFSNLLYAVFAMGDSSYKYFCRAGRGVDALLARGGGSALLPLTLCDARDPLQEDVFEDWSEKVTLALAQRGGVPLSDSSETPPEPQLCFRFTPDKACDPFVFPPPPSLLEPSVYNPLPLEVVAKTTATARREEDGSYVMRLAVRTKGTAVGYQAGDHLGIYPENPPSVVEAYRIALHIAPTDWEAAVELCTVVNARARASLRNVFPARVSLRTVFEHYIDLCGKPRKSTLRLLSKYCSDAQEKASLLELLRRSDGSVNGAMLVAPFRTVLDCLRRFPSCQGIPIGHFLEVMPRVQPRYYSIASDMLSQPARIEIFSRIRPDGLNSMFLERVKVGNTITAFVRKSTFHLPTKCGDRPVVMIGPGTGVASMIGFCHRRAAFAKKQPNASTGDVVLFFGAQSRKDEYFVRGELEMWAPQGEGRRADTGTHTQTESLITLLDLAFSRDQPERVHVTHLIEKHKDYLFKLFTRSSKSGGCLLYLSGDASAMAKSVDEALVGVLEYGGLTRTAAEEFLGKMEQEKRYLKDVY